MAWNNIGSKPSNVRDIIRNNFTYPNKVIIFFKIIGMAIGGFVICFILSLFLPAVFCILTCGESKGGSSLDFLAYLLWFIGPLVGGIAAFIEYKQDCDRIDAELSLVKNYHIYNCKNAFYNHVVKDMINQINNICDFVGDTDTLRGYSLYSEAASFASDYVRNPSKYNTAANMIEPYLGPHHSGINYVNYEKECPSFLLNDLKDELNRYIDSNIDEIIVKADKCLSNTQINSGLQRAVLILKFGERNSNIDAMLSKINKSVPRHPYEKMIIENKVNDTMLNDFMAYDQKITEDLFESEYKNFQGLSTSRTPSNLLDLLSVESYILFMWYFALQGNYDLYEKSSNMVRHIFSNEIESEINIAQKVCYECINRLKHNKFQPNDQKTLKLESVHIKLLHFSNKYGIIKE